MLQPVDITTSVATAKAKDFLVYPWLLPGRLTLMVGPTNIGKTTLTLDIIAQCFEGKRIWDRFPCRRVSKILYLHAEHSLATLQEAAKLRGEIPENAIHVIHDFGDLGSSLIRPDGMVNAQLYGEIRELARHLKPELIIAEPISSFLLNENDNSQARRTVHLLASLGADVGAAVLTHHHVGKGYFDPDHPRPKDIASGGARGAMAFEDASERVIYIHRHERKREESPQIKLETVKTKDFPISPAYLSFNEESLRYEYIPNILANRDLIAVYNERRQHPNETPHDLADRLRQLWNCSPNKIYLMLSRCQKVGLLDTQYNPYESSQLLGRAQGS